MTADPSLSGTPLDVPALQTLLARQIQLREAAIRALEIETERWGLNSAQLTQVREELAHWQALASALPALVGDRERLRELEGAAKMVCLAFHDWPEYTGSEVCRGEREHALESLAVALTEDRAPVAARSVSVPGDPT